MTSLISILFYLPFQLFFQFLFGEELVVFSDFSYRALCRTERSQDCKTVTAQCIYFYVTGFLVRIKQMITENLFFRENCFSDSKAQIK